VPFPTPEFDHLQYENMEREGLGDPIMHRDVSRQTVDTWVVMPNEVAQALSCRSV